MREVLDFEKPERRSLAKVPHRYSTPQGGGVLRRRISCANKGTGSKQSALTGPAQVHSMLLLDAGCRSPLQATQGPQSKFPDVHESLLAIPVEAYPSTGQGAALSRPHPAHGRRPWL
jgi:hypothetical protein